jgi:hypothetical protein
MNQMTTAPAAPIMMTQRQPSTSSGASGTSHQDSNATVGTAENITA